MLLLCQACFTLFLSLIFMSRSDHTVISCLKKKEKKRTLSCVAKLWCELFEKLEKFSRFLRGINGCLSRLYLNSIRKLIS